MRQYNELKAQAGDALMLFRMGDFYEVFGQDAIIAARILEITLTSRDKGKADALPMAGVPHHSAPGYIQRLLKAGQKVAICEQVEDPAQAKGIVRREIVRFLTPAVQFDHETSEPAYLATALPVPTAKGAEDLAVLACLDASTGECLFSEPLTLDALDNEASRLSIRHFLKFGEPAPATFDKETVLIEALPTNYLSREQAFEAIRRHMDQANPEILASTPEALHAIGILITYVAKTQNQAKLSHLRPPAPLHRASTMVLGPRSAAHLDLVPSQDGTPNLFQMINRTRSSLGSRQLRRWLLEPLARPAEIVIRQTAIQELSQSESLMDRASAELGGLYDLERLAGRVNAGLANPRDTLAIGKSLDLLPRLAALLDSSRAGLLQALKTDLLSQAETARALSQRILETQNDEETPLTSRDGGIFKKGTNAELDRLIDLSENGSKWLVELEARERARTGISSLKVRYNRVFGYYIEVTQAHLKNVPSDYQRKQTTVGAERFFTEELKKFEEEILTASVRQKSLEQELFQKLLEEVQAHTAPIMAAARLLGELDALVSLARLALEPAWVFPVIDESLDLEIVAGRHPLVDSGAFVPNSASLSPSTRMTLLITGPNMGGKSTVMRQVALIVLLGQMGAPVPAQKARWGAFSSIYTRIGAHDAISRGQSTFMVEMTELAHLLHHADERSLLILDEIGRGTSTYDGMSVAWSTLEWICKKTRARTLFATHYHELTRLEGELPGLANAHMAVESSGSGTRSGTLRFLYQLREGPANESFGIHVARLAGLPQPVIQRAWQVLEELESQAPASQSGASADQLSLFIERAPERKPEPLPEPPPAWKQWMERIEEQDINEMTPLQALNFLSNLQELSRPQAPQAQA